MVRTRSNCSRFPTTIREDLGLIRDKGAGVHEALSRFCESYWPPVYSFIRQSGKGPEEAADLTQGFFEKLIEDESIVSWRPRDGHFRSWLLACLRRFIVDEWRKFSSAKNRPPGGWMSLDSDEAETYYEKDAIDSESPQIAYDRCWALHFFDTVLKELEEQCRAEGQLEVFGQMVAHLGGNDLKMSHGEAAKRMGMSTGTLKNEVTTLRKRYARIIRERLRLETGTAVGAEEELRYLVFIVAGS